MTKVTTKRWRKLYMNWRPCVFAPFLSSIHSRSAGWIDTSLWRSCVRCVQVGGFLMKMLYLHSNFVPVPRPVCSLGEDYPAPIRPWCYFYVELEAKKEIRRYSSPTTPTTFKRVMLVSARLTKLTLFVGFYFGLVSGCEDDHSHGHDHFRRLAPSTPLTPPTRPLDWGNVNVIHTTDTHGWLLGHQKKSFPEPNYRCTLFLFSKIDANFLYSIVATLESLLLLCLIWSGLPR